MANCYISFLGTSPYLECHYYFTDKNTQYLTEFVQEATIQHYCRNWTSHDRILIFVTKEAKEKNWAKLKIKINTLKIKAQLKVIDINSGHSEHEIWSIFKTVYDEIHHDDQLFFDITHAFRSIPLLALSIINYSKVLKNTQVKNISYGAFEVIGSYKIAENLPVDQRYAPIFDLSSFDTLSSWTQAIDIFQTTGNTSKIINLAQHSLVPVIKEDKNNKAKAIDLKRVAEKLGQLTQALNCNRALSLNDNAEKLMSAIEEVRNQLENQQLIPAFMPLLEQLEKMASKFTQNQKDYHAGFKAVEWCLEHDLIPQAYTVFLETLVTWVLSESGLSKIQIKDKRYRILVNELVKDIQRPKESNTLFPYPDISTDIDEEKKSVIRSTLSAHKDILVLMDNLIDFRNNINHADYTKETYDAQTITDKIKDLHQRFKGMEKL